VNILNKQLRTDNKGWPSSLGVGRGVNKPLTVKKNLLRKLLKSLGPGRILWINDPRDPDVGGWIILRWILERWDGVMWTGLVWLRIGTGGELL
jgi:hypothetical protein